MDANRLYCAITDQMSIPAISDRDAAIENLETILDYYEHDLTKAIENGKPIFAEWCNTRRKDSQFYSQLNPGWLTWWLKRIAPHPKVDTVSSVAEQIAREVRAHQ